VVRLPAAASILEIPEPEKPATRVDFHPEVALSLGTLELEKLATRVERLLDILRSNGLWIDHDYEKCTIPDEFVNVYSMNV
jgi:hypothetical protein